MIITNHKDKKLYNNYFKCSPCWPSITFNEIMIVTFFNHTIAITNIKPNFPSVLDVSYIFYPCSLFQEFLDWCQTFSLNLGLIPLSTTPITIIFPTLYLIWIRHKSFITFFFVGVFGPSPDDRVGVAGPGGRGSG